MFGANSPCQWFEVDFAFGRVWIRCWTPSFPWLLLLPSNTALRVVAPSDRSSARRGISCRQTAIRILHMPCASVAANFRGQEIALRPEDAAAARRSPRTGEILDELQPTGLGAAWKPRTPAHRSVSRWESHPRRASFNVLGEPAERSSGLLHIQPATAQFHAKLPKLPSWKPSQVFETGIKVDFDLLAPYRQAARRSGRLAVLASAKRC